eukprot:261663_1
MLTLDVEPNILTLDVEPNIVTMASSSRTTILVIQKSKNKLQNNNKININETKIEPIESFTFDSLKKTMKIHVNSKQRLSITQSGTSPINQSNANIIKYDPSHRLSLYLTNIQDPIHKSNQIKRLLRYSNLTQTDIAISLPTKYDEKFELIKPINSGLQGVINIVKCKETKQKYAMKSIKYKSIYQLQQHLQRFLIVYQHKFMIYKDIFIDVNNKLLHIIQPLFKQTITEKLCKLKNRKFNKLQMKSIILQLIQKINCMHSIGYVHHDLKPSNIMFDKNNKLHIIDFDLMEQMGTNIMGTKGTVGFIAPELFIPSIDKTGKTKINSKQSMDIWSIGSIICYIAFKGNIPFNNIINNKRINNLKQYMNMHSFLNENDYRENKWSFIVDVKIDYSRDYNSKLFQLISDLLAFKPKSRPNASTLLTSNQYSWFNK